jgi:hypothetical protein
MGREAEQEWGKNMVKEIEKLKREEGWEEREGEVEVEV